MQQKKIALENERQRHQIRDIEKQQIEKNMRMTENSRRLREKYGVSKKI